MQDFVPEFANFIGTYQAIFHMIYWLIISAGLMQNFIYIFQLPFAWRELKERSSRGDTESAWHQLISKETLPISLIAPAYNEELTIVTSVRSLLALQYPDFEVIVVNDGSSDNTLGILIETFSLEAGTRASDMPLPHAKIRHIYRSKKYSRLVVVDKENGKGKADASNAGINFARKPLFCIVDADCLLEVEALLSCVRPFVEDPQHMVAVGGTIRVLNGCVVKDGCVTEARMPRSFITLMQAMEYIRAFLIARLAWSRWGMLAIISGGFGIFKREITIEAGGFSTETCGEDYDLVIKLHRLMRDRDQTYAMRYVPEPVCWTEAPSDLKTLGNQRKRWQRGALEVFFHHKAMLLNPKYGRIGMLLMPMVCLVDVIGPLVELAGYFLIPLFWMLGAIDFSFMLAYIGVFFMAGVCVSLMTLVLEEAELSRTARLKDLLLLAGAAILENFGYRQLNNFWRLAGWLQFLQGNKSWGVMARKGTAAYNSN